ncbi:MAG: hypothetical protein LV479_08465 [Methylacidiphilales bacterium]|nr:hypothetical protein [Candidatus Methylacidiphilales bacterium]
MSKRTREIFLENKDLAYCGVVVGVFLICFGIDLHDLGGVDLYLGSLLVGLGIFALGLGAPAWVLPEPKREMVED